MYFTAAAHFDPIWSSSDPYRNIVTFTKLLHTAELKESNNLNFNYTFTPIHVAVL